MAQVCMVTLPIPMRTSYVAAPELNFHLMVFFDPRINSVIGQKLCVSQVFHQINIWLIFAIGEFSPSFTAHFAGGGFNKGAILFVMSLCLAYSEVALIKCVIRAIRMTPSHVTMIFFNNFLF